MITIYSTPTCPRCKLLAAAFQQAGIAYEEKILDASVMARVLCETGIWVQAAPLVLVGSCWYFSDDLFSLASDLLPNWKAILEGNRPRGATFGGMGGEPSDKEQNCKSIWGYGESLK